MYSRFSVIAALDCNCLTVLLLVGLMVGAMIAGVSATASVYRPAKIMIAATRIVTMRVAEGLIYISQL